MKKLFIADEIPSANKGESAIFKGLINALKTYHVDVQITMMTDDEATDSKNYGPDIRFVKQSVVTGKDLIVFLWIHFLFILAWKLKLTFLSNINRELWNAYIDADMILVGHDDTLAASEGIINGFISLNKWIQLLFVGMLKKPSIIPAGSLGPYTMGYPLIKYVLKRITYITVRDPISYRQCEKILGDAGNQLYLSADLAFLVQPAQEEEISSHLRQLVLDQPHGPVIGMVMVRGSRVFKHAFIKNQPNLSEDQRYETHNRIIARLVDHLIQTLGAQVVFIPHAIEPNRDDRVVARDIYRLVKRQEQVILIEEDYPVEDLKKFLSNMDMCIGERTHFAINTSSMRVPVLALSFPTDYRTYGIVGEMLELPEDVYDIETLDIQSLQERVNKVWQDREQIRSLLMKNIPLMESQALLVGKLISESLHPEAS